MSHLNLPLEFHAELKNYCEPMQKEAIEGLKELVKQDGLLSKIVAWPVKVDGETHYYLVDGHHRYIIALELNVPYEVHLKHFRDLIDAKKWMRDVEQNRKNLSAESLAHSVGCSHLLTIEQFKRDHPNEAVPTNDIAKKVADESSKKTGQKISVSSVKRAAEKVELVKQIGGKVGEWIEKDDQGSGPW